MTKVKIVNGIHKGLIFKLEGTIEEVLGDSDLVGLAFFKGNMAAKNAIEENKYTYDDAPFYYGKIDSLGYIISKKDLELA